ncbi:unnamed protein product, partial [Rotaria sp. Silwood2]
EVREDVSGQFQNAMLLGDVGEYIKLLRQCNQTKLAANLHIDETVTCAGGWTDEDDLNRENLNNKQDELGES